MFGKGRGLGPLTHSHAALYGTYIYMRYCCHEVGAVVHILCKATYCTCVSTLDPMKEIHILYNLFRYVNGDKPGFYFPCLPSYWTGSARRQTTRGEFFSCTNVTVWTFCTLHTCAWWHVLPRFATRHTNERRGQRLTTC